MATIHERETLYEGTMVRVERVEVERADGTRAQREVVRHDGAVAIVALQGSTDVVAQGQQLLLVRQFRPALGEEVLELIAGRRDQAGESALATAQRELHEEAGYEADEWIELGTLASSPGFTDERVTLFLARRLRLVGQPADAPEEALTPCTMPLTLAMEEIRQGKMQDAKTVAGILWAALYLQHEQSGH